MEQLLKFIIKSIARPLAPSPLDLPMIRSTYVNYLKNSLENFYFLQKCNILMTGYCKSESENCLFLSLTHLSHIANF